MTAKTHPWSAEFGGPVYPLTLNNGDGSTTVFTGMTLRDWFAGQALAGIKACSIVGEHHIDENTAKFAYRLADMMLAERDKKPTV